MEAESSDQAVAERQEDKTTTDETAAPPVPSGDKTDHSMTGAVDVKSPQNLETGHVKVEKEMLPIEVPATSVSKTQFQCRICDAVFSKRWNCVSHMRAHVRVRPVFFCPKCGKRCSKRSELEIHLRIHTGDKPYTCPECQRCFVRQGQLNSHMRIHTGAKPHMCQDCGALFASGSNLKRHQRCCAKSSVRIRTSKALGKFEIVECETVHDKPKEQWNKMGPFPTKLIINRHNTPRLQNIIQMSSLQGSTEAGISAGKANFRACSSVATNTDYDVARTSVKKRLSECPRNYNSEISSCARQLIPQSVTARPAVAETQSPVVVHATAKVLDKNLKQSPVHVTHTSLIEISDPKKLTTREAVSVGDSIPSQDNSAPTSTLLTIVPNKEEGEISLSVGSEAETSNGALSNVMQVDWSFLLEDPGLHQVGQSAEQLQHLGQSSEPGQPVSQSAQQLHFDLVGQSPNSQSAEQLHSADQSTAQLHPLSDELVHPVLPESASAISSSSFPVISSSAAQVGSAMVISSEGFQLSDPASAETPPVFQLSGTVSPSAFQMNGSSLPVIVPIPHIPAVDVKHIQIQQELVGELKAGELQTVEVTSASGPVTVVVKQVYPDQFQVVQEVPVIATSDTSQLLTSGQTFPQQHTISLIPHDTSNLTNNNNNSDNNNDSIAETVLSQTVVKKEQLKPYVCDICCQCFARKWYLTVHRNAHFRQKTFACKQCSAEFSRVGNLNRHMQTHTGVKPFHCKKCQSCFGSKYRLLEHERRHDKLRPYRCDICSCCFTDCSSLRRHQQAHKGDNLEHTCDVCGAQFRTLHSLTFHLKLHGGKDGSGCAEKTIALDENECLAKDMPIVPLGQARVYDAAKTDPCVLKSTNEKGQNAFLCSVCQKSFLYSAACRQHILCHTGSRPFKCTDCGAKFSRKADAKRHTRIHERGKLHLCSKCGQKFQTKSRLVLHLDEHQSQKSLTVPCGECGKKFSKTRVLKIHKSTFHRRQVQLAKFAKLSLHPDQKDHKSDVDQVGNEENIADGGNTDKSVRIRRDSSSDRTGDKLETNHEGVMTHENQHSENVIASKEIVMCKLETNPDLPDTTSSSSAIQSLPPATAPQSTLRDPTIPQRAAAKKQRDFLARLTPKRNSRKSIVKS